MRPLNRPTPALPVTAMQTYAIKSPIETHTKPAHCRDVGCLDYRLGWTFKTIAGSDDDRFFRRACAGAVDGIRRPFTVARDGIFVIFKFEPGVRCRKAAAHRLSLERPEIYLVRGGDWRANTGLIRRHNKPEHWVEDFAETLDATARRAGVR